MSEEPTPRGRRGRTRRRLLLLGLLPLLLALAFAGRVAMLLYLDTHGRASYVDQDFGTAQDAFGANATVNLLEPWISPFDEGTARYRLGDYPGAVTDFETALTDVPPAQECRVRIDLSLAQESVGDAAAADGDRTSARSAWKEAVAALEGCLMPSATVQPAQASAARTTDARLLDKLETAEPQSDQPDASGGSAADQLANRNQRGEKIRNRNQQHQLNQQDKPTDSPSSPPVDHW